MSVAKSSEFCLLLAKSKLSFDYAEGVEPDVLNSISGY